MALIKDYSFAETVKLTDAGGAVASGKHRVHAYVIVTDGTNAATLKLYKNTETAANQLWEEQVVGADLAKSFPFSPALGGDGENDTLVLVVSVAAGVATAYVQVS